MVNPILQRLNQQTFNPMSNVLSQAKQIMNNGGQLMNIVQAMTSGKNAEAVFYEECKKRGVNTQDILSIIK